MAVVLAMDLGTTGNRVIAFSQDGSVKASAYYEFDQLFPKPGWVEHRPGDIYETAVKALTDVLAQLGDEDIVSMGVTNQRETTILWDKSTGDPVYNAIVWQCRRTADICQDLSAHADTIKSKTGLFLDPYFSGTKIRWILDNVEEAKTVYDAGNLAFGTVDSWVIWNLTHGTTHATDHSNASRTLLYNLTTTQYDDELLDLFGVDRTILPAIFPSDGDFGHYDDPVSGRQIPIVGVLGDQQAALFAQGGGDLHAVKNTYGTGLFVVAATGQDIPKTNTLINTVAWHRNGQIGYALEGSIFVGGSAVQWLRDGLKLVAHAADTESLATSVPSSDGVYFVPALVGLGAPYWNPHCKGMLVGLTRGTTQAHVARAVLESLAFQTKDVMTEIAALLPGQEISELKVDGGAVGNQFLMQTQSDILGFPVQKPKISESTAFGAAGVSGVKSGLWTEAKLREINGVEVSYYPQNKGGVEKDYKNWKKAVRLCLEFH